MRGNGNEEGLRAQGIGRRVVSSTHLACGYGYEASIGKRFTATSKNRITWPFDETGIVTVALTVSS